MGMDQTRKISSSSHSGKSSGSQHANNQGVATLIVMVAVLLIIVLFCCFAAPGIRGLCRRYIFRTCAIDDPDLDNVGRFSEEETAPTVIFLPNGRMLVVDRRFFSHFRPENRGIELMEINSDLIRTRTQMSTPSILDSSDTSKGISPISLGHPPPSYNEVFPDFPPSYSEISLLMKNLQTVEMGHVRTCAVTETCENETTVVNVNVLTNERELDNVANDNINNNDNNNHDGQSMHNNDNQTNNNNI